jgi:hypothetical protein
MQQLALQGWQYANVVIPQELPTIWLLAHRQQLLALILEVYHTSL